jgi:hypothetical protein
VYGRTRFLIFRKGEQFTCATCEQWPHARKLLFNTSIRASILWRPPFIYSPDYCIDEYLRGLCLWAILPGQSGGGSTRRSDVRPVIVHLVDARLSHLIVTSPVSFLSSFFFNIVGQACSKKARVTTPWPSGRPSNDTYFTHNSGRMARRQKKVLAVWNLWLIAIADIPLR